ncbi:GAF domain-containing protein [Leptolyngbya sp. FACHB-711]|uniref:GAF domain-containing protein n=1 Tax=unclassified Leptolyngbya TaxID=2650499 RepID=UPI001683E161|nr:GAF domain-containing protein [Leptolyngbya sp. FACHB-711]MBD2024729.1 GAF domain-containing protein [Leptolyngbya sp. FACHB-711]
MNVPPSLNSHLDSPGSNGLGNSSGNNLGNDPGNDPGNDLGNNSNPGTPHLAIDRPAAVVPDQVLPPCDAQATLPDIPLGGIPSQGVVNSDPGHITRISNSALTARKQSFSDFLAPLKQETFKQVVADVEQRLHVVNQTLSLLDNVLDARGFELILNEMLRSITLKTGELLNADRTTIFLLDEDKDELWSIHAEGDDNGKSLEIRIPRTMGIAGEVATTKQAINIPYDFYQDARSKAAQELDKKNNYRSYTMLTMPLLSDGGDLVAVVQLINKLKPGHAPLDSLDQKIDLAGFTSDDEQLFSDFAPSIRLILESSRSFYKATQQQRAASALIKATKALSQSSLDLEETLKKVMDEAKELMQADRSTLWLIDREKHELWTKLPNRDGELRELRIPMGAGFAGQVAMNGEPVLIPFDLYDHPNSAKSKETDKKTGYRTCSMLCMPVFNADNELIAVTQLINKKRTGNFFPYDPATYPEAPECWRASFNRSDQEFMRSFNDQAGVALQNAKLFATVKQQEQTQRDILRSLSNGVISTDKEGRVIAANERAKKLLGFAESASLEGRSVTDLILIDKSNFSGWFANVFDAAREQNRQYYYADQTLLSTDGTTHHSINLTLNPIADATNPEQVSGGLVVIEDISREKRFKNAMSRYMSQELVERALNGELKLGGDRKEVSVLFSDIRSYTTLTESMEAHAVVDMLNEYFESMVDAIFRYDGALDKYIGDAIMAVFGSLVPLKDHPWMAVQSAIEMRERLKKFNENREPERRISIGIGINSDVVISGNIGSSRRMEFTAIGDGVNLGSRLEGASKQYGTDIIISESTYKPCADRIWARELDCIRVKGKNKPVGIYELVGLRDEPIADERKQAIDLYHQAREFYLNRKFARAILAFGTLLEDFDCKDKAAQMHLKRCEHWLTNPPTETEWADGVWTLTEK